MIEVYILRHGLAKSREDWKGRKDSDRPLTGKGEKKMIAAAKAMKRAGMAIDIVLSSPFVRARRTAEIVAEVLGIRSKLKLANSLAPEGNPKRFLQEIVSVLNPSVRILVAGHEPYLGRLISLCLTGGTDVVVDLKKGGLCKLTAEGRKLAGHCTLEWFLTPDQLVSLR